MPADLPNPGRRPAPPTRRRSLLRLAGAGAAAALWPPLAPAQLKSGDQPEASPRWQQVRASVFAGREILPDGDAVARLDVPGRAEDAALMPLAVRAQFAQTAQRHIRRIWLVIDNNPSPLSSVFSFTLASGRADFETRVRVDEYTFIRAISETNDGRLHASTRFVKAAGGCSAPPGKDHAAALATLGQMRLRVITEPAAAGQPLLAQLMISHPNDSGFVMDQLSRQHVPPHFVRRIDIRYGGEPVLQADVDFSLSENPNLRFYFVAARPGDLAVQVEDSREQLFQQRLALAPVDG
jgi:sulfur-oxidizing protein SoxY